MTENYKELFLFGSDADALEKYLLDHEESIADEENDFGDLYNIFLSVFGRSPNG